MSNLYLSLADFKASEVADLSADTSHDSRLLQLLEGVSRQVDRSCKRHFFSYTQARYLRGTGGDSLWLPQDLIAVTTLKEDADRDGTFEVTWAATDYVLGPDAADPTGPVAVARPYRRIEVNRRSNGTQGAFHPGQRRYELTGQWGYCGCTEATGASIDEGAEFGDSDTTLTVTDGALIDVGQTLLVASEQLYVGAKSGNDLTVTRGMNGTTATAHPDATAISRYVYPPAIVEAVLMQAARLWSRRLGGFSREIGFTETGAMQPVRGLDDDVKQLLSSYVLKVA